jgi:hypothetical protein
MVVHHRKMDKAERPDGDRADTHIRFRPMRSEMCPANGIATAETS